MQAHLRDLFVYKTLHALCTTGKDGHMRAVYYVSCLVHGKAPLWAVWRVADGRPIGVTTSRDEIEELYPNHSWRKVMARWTLFDDADAKASERRQQLRKELPGKAPAKGEKAASGAARAALVH